MQVNQASNPEQPKGYLPIASTEELTATIAFFKHFEALLHRGFFPGGDAKEVAQTITELQRITQAVETQISLQN